MPSATPRGSTRHDPLVDATAERRYVITLSCPDTTGIVARISDSSPSAGGWIIEAGYHSDPDTGWFFTRQVVRADSLPFEVDELRERFAAVAAELGGQTDWTVTDTGVPKRAVLLVSKEAHCLHDLLGRVAGRRAARPAGRGDRQPRRARRDRARARRAVPPRPFPRGPRRTRRGRGVRRGARTGRRARPRRGRAGPVHADPAARAVRAWAGRAINIHHSFLPSFVGARPYHQAYARGVKLIGATCHYVTADLDAGPIIEQDVIRVDHGDTAADMVRRGRDIERLVLARGLRWHLEDRVLVHGNKTVVVPLSAGVPAERINSMVKPRS